MTYPITNESPRVTLDGVRAELELAAHDLEAWHGAAPGARVRAGYLAVGRILAARAALDGMLPALDDALRANKVELLAGVDVWLARTDGEVYERQDPEAGPVPTRPHEGYQLSPPHRHAAGRWETPTQDLRRGGTAEGSQR